MGIKVSSKLKVKHVRQDTRYDCTTAAATMVANAHGDSFGLPINSTGIKNESDKAAFLFLACLSEMPGWTYRTLRSNVENILKEHGPLIANIRLSAHPGLGHVFADWTHWVVIVATTDDDKVMYLDPAKDSSPQYMKFGDLEELVDNFYFRT